MPIRSASEKNPPNPQAGDPVHGSPAASVPASTATAPQESQASRFIRTVIDKTERDLLKWYPPFFLESHPEIRAAVVAFCPQAKAALDIESEAFALTKNILNHTGGKS